MDSSCNLRAEHNFILRSFHIERARAPELGFRSGQSAELKLKTDQSEWPIPRFKPVPINKKAEHPV